MEPAEKKLFGSIIAQIPELVGDIYKDLIQKTIRELANNDKFKNKIVSESTVINELAKKIDNGESYYDVMNNLAGEDVFLNAILFKKISQKINSVRSKNFVPEVEFTVNNSNSIDSIIQKSGKKIPNLEPSEDLKWLNSFFSSNKTVLNFFRKFINNELIKYQEKTKITSEKVDIIFKDLLRTTKKINADYQNINKDEIATELRNTAQKISIIQEMYSADKKQLYDEIERVLLDNVDESGKEKIPKLMEKLRDADPFRPLKEGERWISRSYAFQFLDNTATSQTLYNVGRIIKNGLTRNWSEFGKELKLLFSRIPSFLLTGSPKTWRDVDMYFDEIGPTKGLIRLTKDIWWATHVGLPLTIAAWNVLQNLYYLFFTPDKGEEKGTVEADVLDELGDAFLSQYQGYPFGFGDKNDINTLTVVLGLLSPGHFFLDDVWNWVGGKGDEAEEGKLRPNMTPQELINLYIKHKIPEALQEKLSEAVKSKSVVEAEKIIKDALEKFDNESVNKATTSLTSDIFYLKYPCYEKLIDTSYEDRGVKIDGNKIFIKYKNPSKVYSATLDIDGKLYWNDDSGIKTTATLSCP